jgi:hypothetical protein
VDKVLRSRQIYISLSSCPAILVDKVLRSRQICISLSSSLVIVTDKVLRSASPIFPDFPRAMDEVPP